MPAEEELQHEQVIDFIESRNPKPAFEQGTIVTTRALVTDKNGRSWWVDPSAMMVVRV